jgi:hypothetical protein
MSSTDNARTVEQARQRYGKPFAHERPVSRLTEPSLHLRHLNRLSRRARDAQARGQGEPQHPSETLASD